MQLSPNTIADFTNHVLLEYPNEACGLIVDNEYVPCLNIADDKASNFKIAVDDYLDAERSGNLQAVMHSHPYALTTKSKWDPSWPSENDMHHWLAMNIPWGIVSTDGEGISQVNWMDESYIAPLEGREFVHGVHDCYAVVRDWFRVNWNLTLNNYARGIEWWDQGQNLYVENFAKEGFVEIQAEEVKVGDVALIRVASPVINHAAVVTGTNQILHHLFHRQSGYDTLAKWNRTVRKYVRYQGPR